MDIIDEFSKQDFIVKEANESPLTRMIGERLKEKATDYIVGILSRFRI